MQQKRQRTVNPNSADLHAVPLHRSGKLRNLSGEALAPIPRPSARGPVCVNAREASSAGVVVRVNKVGIDAPALCERKVDEILAIKRGHPTYDTTSFLIAANDGLCESLGHGLGIRGL